MIELIAEHEFDGSGFYTGMLRVKYVDPIGVEYFGEYCKNIGEALNTLCIELMEMTGIDLHEHNFSVTHKFS